MEFSRDYLFELLTTRKLSDFRFTAPDKREIPVHRVILSARSPIFKSFFETHKGKKADYLDLVRCEGIMGYDDNDEEYKEALREAVLDIVSFCYLNGYSNCRRDASKYFKIRVLPHLLTHALAERFELPELVVHAEDRFREAFVWFCNNATDDNIESALGICSSPDLVKQRHVRGETWELLRDTTGWMLEQQLKNYKSTGRIEKATKLASMTIEACAKSRQPNCNCCRS